MKRLSLLLAMGGVCAWSMDIPHLGFVRDAQGIIHPVDGVSGNFLVGDGAGALTLAFAWNGSFGIRKTGVALEWWDRSGQAIASMDAPAGGAIIGFDRDGGSTAWVYSKSARTVSRITAGDWNLHEILATDEDVLALSGGRDSVDVAVRRAEGVFVESFDRISGSLLSQVPLGRPATQIELLSDGGVLGVDGTRLWLRRSDGSEWWVDTGARLLGIERMGLEWVHLQARMGEFALRIRPGAEPVLYGLPMSQAVTQ